jgi:EAL domain-containing protein (putative c-di-GMP-specific phosphodiesterase class I)
MVSLGSSSAEFASIDALPFTKQLDRILSGELTTELLFQPIVDLRRGVVTGYEALARFPVGMDMSPDVCLRRAGLLGRRQELEHLLCGMVLTRRCLLPRNRFLTMNLGPDYLMSDMWQQLLVTERDLAGVVIEITEESSISNYEEIRTRSEQIRAMGGLVAVDDAGAGYASLQHILELRPDFIKLNRHFVKDCHLDRAKSTMIEMMSAAADRLDAWVIAEGVETIPELDELIRIGVPLAQGYLLAHPEVAMEELDQAVAGDISQRSRMNLGRTLQPHLSACALSSTVRAAGELLNAQKSCTAAVVTDRWRHPTQVLHRHPLVGVRVMSNFTKAQVSSSPRQVLHRALSREAETRFDPVVVINNEGECVGIVDIDRLMLLELSFDGDRQGRSTVLG